MSGDAIPFWVAGEEEPKTFWDLSDGGVEIRPLPPVRVPSANPANWTDEACEAAFEVIADNWREPKWDVPAFGLIMPVVSAVCLSQSQFAEWIKRCGYNPPSFWAADAPQGRSEKRERKVPAKKRGPAPIKTDRVRRDMLKKINEGKLTLEDLRTMKQIALGAMFGVHKDTAQNAAREILLEFAGDKNSG